ncbi:MAG: hypothetical protein M1820_003828 [Bogoriella megaspora]|nr:MAG: hypothetical protein M1820_003828 [Bogoriella megaspora]
MTSAYDPIQQAFDVVIRDFRSQLNDDMLYSEILNTTNIDQVYNLTNELQEEQAKKGRLRNLAKIQPFLEGLNSYANVIEVFMQAKSDVLALIWGPIKLLIQWASVLKQSFDAIVNTTADIGVLLPEFREMAKIFHENNRIKDVLVLFLKDLLDFYVIALKFFSQSRWKYFFESMWPRLNNKIKIVVEHIKRVTLLLRTEVNLEHIQAEYQVRLRALEHFERTEKSHMRQEFASIKADISPMSYEDTLYHIQHRVLKGTGTWLLKEPHFVKWLDSSSSGTKLLWFQGIPGAGKTYLSSTVVEVVETRGRPVFAFLSHNFRNKTTALSILHSFIFQLASENDDLEEVLCHSSRENLKRSADAAVRLLTTLLSCAGPVYIIIDGLDEIDEMERGLIVEKLLYLSKTCENTKVLFSSRPEADIVATLEEKTANIRLDHHNLESIQTFITMQMQKWFKDRDFLPEAQVEIKRLLAPLALRSKGITYFIQQKRMFLYVKVVLSNIQDLDVYEVLNELAVLPESLDNAYSRVLARVNSLRPHVLKEKARKLIGWIGCAPTPLTIQEAEQALLIKPNDLEDGARVLSSFNIIKVCGSIVEIVDDYIQFVHFTVKEYFFSPRISGFIDIAEATLSLTICCIAYLCQRYYNEGITSEEISNFILSGAYRLHNFATTMWFELAGRTITLHTEDPPKPLTNILQVLLARRKNGRSDDNTSTTSPLCFSEDPALQEMMSKQAEFRDLCSKAEFDGSHGDEWVDLDPLTISGASVRIHAGFDTLWCTLTESEAIYQRSVIKRHHGRRSFKCGFLNCSFHRHGFESLSERKSHMKQHQRPWKCSIPGCEFAEGGFLSRRMRDEHFSQFHRKIKTDKDAAFENLNDDEIVPLLFDLVKADKVEPVRDLIMQFMQNPNLPPKEQDLEQLCRLAAVTGSSDMVRLLDESMNNSTRNYRKWRQIMLRGSASTGNLESVQYLLSQIKSQNYETVESYAFIVLESDSDELYDEWIKHVQFETKLPDAGETHPRGNELISANVIRATAHQPQREEMLLRIWTKMNLRTSCKATRLGAVLVNVASTTCSVKLATFLLDCGVAPDSRRRTTYPTPLRYAARQTTAEAAQLAKLLLLRGANPEPSMKKMNTSREREIVALPMREEKGAKDISKWLDMSWDELVLQTQREREQLGVTESTDD